MSQKLASRLDDYWINLRLREPEIPTTHLLRSIPSKNINSMLPTIDYALELYLKVKGGRKKNTFFTHSKRTIAYLKQFLDSRLLNQYSTADATTFRDWLRKKGLSSTSV